MTLDNRPKKLLLKGVKDEHLQAVRDWYEVSIVVVVSIHCSDFCVKTTGQLDSVDVQEGEGVIVAFKTRSAAEQVDLVFSVLQSLRY
jgi:RNA-binding protein 26